MKTKKLWAVLTSLALVVSLLLPGLAFGGTGYQKMFGVQQKVSESDYNKEVGKRKGPGANGQKEHMKENNKQQGKNQESKRIKNQVKNRLADVANHWARKNIERLNLEGVVRGYANGTFQPNKPVTMAEVITMVVKALGYEDEAQAKMNATLLFNNGAAVPRWAVGYIAVAIDKNLIDPSVHFQPNKAASRIAVTTVLVKALGIDPGKDAVQAAVYFSDTNTLDQNSKEYLILAVVNDLIKGYGDKTFKPHKPVTRAEMATLLGLLEDKLGTCLKNGRVKGILVSVDAANSKISMATNVTDYVYGSVYKEVKDYKVIDEAAIYRNGQPAELTDLKAGDRVLMLLNAEGNVVYLEAKEFTADQKYIRGEVTAVDTANKKLELLRFGVLKVTYNVSEDVKVVVDDKEAELEDIGVGDQVKVELNADGVVIKIIK